MEGLLFLLPKVILASLAMIFGKKAKLHLKVFVYTATLI